MGVPAYSEAGLQARDVFFAGIAPLHFFVEDEDLENLYSALIARLFPRLRDFEVFPLRGKANVLAHAGLPPEGGVIRIYVLDKDFDDILGRLVSAEPVFYLDHYNLEMALVDESSLLQICVEERPRVRRVELRNRLDFDQVLADWMPLLDKLHRAFALVQKHDLGLPNTDLAPESFSLVGDPSSLGVMRINEYIEQVIQELINREVISSPDEYPEVSRRVFGTARFYPKHINGKFVTRLWYHKMKRKQLVSNLSQDSLVMRSVSSSQLGNLRGFKRRVAAYLKSKGV